MKNFYVDKFKDVLNSYYEKHKSLNEQIEDNNRRFSPEYAEVENAKVNEQKGKAYNDAKAQIESIYNTVRDYLAIANFPNVESLTADRNFFDNNSIISFSADELNGFVERYKNNYTMLRIIKDWIAKHDEFTDVHPAGKYASVKITMPEDVLKAYKALGEGALSVIDKIYNNNQVTDVALETYADERMAGKLLDIVGDGLFLSDYRLKNVPDNARHSFDDVTLSGANANYYMS